MPFKDSVLELSNANSQICGDITHQIINIPQDDYTYVWGNMTAKIVNNGNNGTNEIIEPYIFTGKAQFDDPDGSYTHYYESKYLFIVYDSHKNIIRIVKTMTCRSDDQIKYEIKNDEVVKIDERYKGVHRIIFEYVDGLCTKIDVLDKMGCWNAKIGDEAPYIDDILSWYLD